MSREEEQHRREERRRFLRQAGVVAGATLGAGYLSLVPKSAVTIVTPRPWYVPGAEATWTAARPTSRQLRFSRFARCSGLCIHILSARRASTSGDDQSRFSPTVQDR